MRFLLATLSVSYARRHAAKTLLTLLGVVVGVATFAAIRSARGSLVGGIRSTVDRMAGKAQLQVSAEGGVPEEIQERLRDLPEVRAQAPVIEQVVVPGKGELGSLLVLGVDLLGDREMRDYGFEGEDADLDDPLLFLAQPDSVAVSRTFAAKAGLKTGDTFEIRAPAGLRRVTVRGLLTPKGFAEAFGGNLVVVDVYAAQELFGRGRRFDRLELRLAEGVTLEAGRAAVGKALGAGFRVETPDRRGEQLEKMISNFTAGFNVTSGFALGIGTFLIFNAFTVSVTRRRRDVGTLRALGATPRQVQLLFLVEAAALGLVGGLLGFGAGAALSKVFLATMGETTQTLFGISSSGEVDLPASLVLESVLLGLVASLAGAWLPARLAASIPPTEAFAKGSFLARIAPVSPRRLAAGAGLLALAVLAAWRPPIGGTPLVLLVLGLGVAGTMVLAPPAARLLLRRAAPLLARVAPVSGRLSADALLGNPRRTSGTVLAMTLSLALVLGMSGYMGSTRASMERWMADVLTSDLFVRASVNLRRPDYRFPASVLGELLAIPGVRSVECFRGAQPEFRGETVNLSSVEIGPMMDRSRHDFLEGDERSMREGLGREGKCAVSDNFARRFRVGVGDVVTLESPSGPVRLPVAAVFRDFSSDKGTIFVDRATFVSNWKDDRVDVYDVNLLRGADVDAVRDAIRAKLAGRMPALVQTRREFVAEIGKAIDGFYALVRITVFLALAVAFLGIVTSLLISVAERTREIGILKALGALGPQIARSVTAEALATALTALVVSVPLGDLVARFMEGTVAEVFAGWRMPHAWPAALFLQLLVALPAVSALAAWIPARQAARVKVTEAIEYE